MNREELITQLYCAVIASGEIRVHAPPQEVIPFIEKALHQHEQIQKALAKTQVTTVEPLKM